MPLCKSCKSDIPKGARLTLAAPLTNVTIKFAHLDEPVSLCPKCQGAALRLALAGIYEAWPDCKPRRGPRPNHLAKCRCSKCLAARKPIAGEETNGE